MIMNKPFSKVFGAQSTTDEVLAGVDLTGKRIMVTGVSAGLGVETARSLAAHGAHVVGAARGKARATTAEIRAQAEGGAELELVQLDLASLASARACADGLMAAGAPFDFVIVNAGVMACPKGTTADGFDTQFGTNHLGHFVLVNRPAGAPPFAYKTVPQGAVTTVWSGVVAPTNVVGGRYCEDCHIAEIENDPNVRAGVRSYALDPVHAKALWAKSEEMVGEAF
jgi:NAD(P)-dependent dehydrogenase (short-subunit alcohol dehydrogenase family)